MDQEIIGITKATWMLFLHRDAQTTFPYVAFGLYDLLSMA